MGKHTPGPWVPTINHDLSIYGEWDDEDALTVSTTKVLRGGDGELAIVVVDMNHPNCWDDELLDANVRLIGAAPKLLAELSDLVDWLTCNQRSIEGEFNMDELLSEARAAIAEVGGDAA